MSEYERLLNVFKEEGYVVTYRCTECDLCFTEYEITGINENGNDLCPACGKALDENDIDFLAEDIEM